MSEPTILNKIFRNSLGYVVAIGSVALATYLKYLAQPKIIPADVPILYFLAIVPTAIFFGLGPSLTVCILSFLAYDYYFLPPIHQINFNIDQAPIMVIFLLVGVLFSYLASNLRRQNQVALKEIASRKQTEAELIKYRDHLEELVKQRTSELEKANLQLRDEINEHKKDEEALRQSEERWSTTLGSIGDGVIATDILGRVTFMNTVAQDLTGWKTGEANQKPIAEVFNIVNETTRQKAENPVDKVLQLGTVCSLANHTILIRKDGTEISIDDSGAPIKDANGITSGVVLVFRDITERRKAEIILRQVEERNRLLADILEHASQPFGIGLPDGSLGIVNKAFCDLTGYTSGELKTMDWAKILTPPEYLSMEAEKLAELVRTGQPVRYQKEYIRKDKSRVPIELLVHLVRNAEGQAEYYYSFLTDITEHKRNEEEVNRLNRELKAINECDQVIVHANDETKLFTDICRIMCEVVGYRLVWIGTVEHDNAKSVLPIAWCGDNNEYLKQANISWDDNQRGRGATGIAARTGKTDFCQDFATEGKAVPWRDAALARGLRSSIAIPLFDNLSNVFAVFTLYATEPNGFTESEIRLLEELAGDLSFGVNTLRSNQERRKAENALRISEEKYRNLFDNMTEGFVVGEIIVNDAAKPTDFRYVEVNNAWTKMTGISQKDAVGRTIKEVFPGISAENLIDNFNKVVVTGESVLFDFYNDDLKRWREIYAYSPQKGLIAYTLKDITDRKKAEEELRQRAEELKTVMDLVPAAIWVAHDSECHNITGNKTANAFYEAEEGENVSAGPAQGEPIPPRRFFHNGKELSAEELPMQKSAALNSDVQGSEFNVLLPSGKSRTLWGSASPLRDPDGRVRGVVAAFLDITERIQTEEVLKQSEEKYRNLFANMVEEVHFWKIEYDDLGRIKTWRLVDANPPALKTWGIGTIEDIKGKTTDEIFGPGSTEHYMPVVQKIIAEGVPYSYEDFFPQLRKYFQFTSVPLRGYFITTGTDITKIKDTEESLRTYAASLEASNKELESFSYSVSHDLRAPLRSITGFSAVLLEDYANKLDKEGKEYLHKIQNSGEKMGQLMDDLLKLARVTRVEMNCEDVNLTDLAEKIIEELATSSPKHRVSVKIDPNLKAYADNNLLRQVMENLLANAWKYSGKTVKPKIEIGTIIHEGKQAFFIRDNGVGFDMAYADKLFQPFQRLHTATDFAGTGIGLSIVQRIIQRHGGKVWAEGKVGEGATFYFTLN
jgi:PAS domain S-box-containing protein